MSGATRVREVRALVRTGGRRSLTWSDRYISLFGLALLVVLASPVVARAVAAVPGDADPARTGAGLALVALLLAGALSLARSAGPLAVSAADASWLVLSPLPRRDVLGRSLLVLTAVGAALGAAVGLALLSAVGASDAPALRLLVSVVLGAAWTLGGAAMAVLAQASQAWDGRLVAVVLALVVAAIAATVMSLGPGQGVLVGAASAPLSAWTAAATASAAAAAGLAVRARAAVGRIPARAVLEASTRTGNATSAFVGLDPSALTWIAEDAHWRSRVLRSRVWPARLRGAAAVAWLDWRGLARRPGRLAVVAASSALPALVSQAGAGTGGALAVLAAGALAVAATGTAGARRDAGDPALSRLLGAGPRALLAARAVLPALLGGAWAALALAGLGVVGTLGPVWALGPLCAPALAAGALRMARRGHVEHASPVVDTPFGPVPIAPVVWALTGADIVALGCLPAVVAFAAGVSGPLLAAQAAWGAAVLAAYCVLSRRR